MKMNGDETRLIHNVGVRRLTKVASRRLLIEIQL